MTFLPLILVPKASPRHLGLLHRHSVLHSPQPRPSPLKGLSAAPVHLKAAGAEGGVQERCAVDLGAPGHIEDPCAGKAVVSRAPFPTSHPWDFLGPAAKPGLSRDSPATQAFSRDTQAPVQSARSTSWEKSLLRCGAMEAARVQKSSGAGHHGPLCPGSAPLAVSADVPSTPEWPEGWTLSS